MHAFVIEITVSFLFSENLGSSINHPDFGAAGWIDVGRISHTTTGLGSVTVEMIDDCVLTAHLQEDLISINKYKMSVYVKMFVLFSVPRGSLREETVSKYAVLS